MRTKCRLIQHAAATAPAQCTLGKTQLRKWRAGPRVPLSRQTHQPGHRFTIGPLTGPLSRTPQSDRGSGNGSEYKTVSRDTARVSATYSRCRPLASAPTIRAGSTTTT